MWYIWYGACDDKGNVWAVDERLAISIKHDFFAPLPCQFEKLEEPMIIDPDTLGAINPTSSPLAWNRFIQPLS